MLILSAKSGEIPGFSIKIADFWTNIAKHKSTFENETANMQDV